MTHIEKIQAHLATLSPEARQDIAAGRWDEVMTDALYAAVGVSTTAEMADARSLAEELAVESTAKKRKESAIRRAAHNIAGCLWEDRTRTGTLTTQLHAVADGPGSGSEGDLTAKNRAELRALAALARD